MEEVVRIEVDPDSGMETIYTCGPEDFEAYAELIVAECMRMCEVTEMSFVTHECDVEASHSYIHVSHSLNLNKRCALSLSVSLDNYVCGMQCKWMPQ
jgi:hypothetical protein